MASDNIKRVYQPEDLQEMAAAFDRAHERLPKALQMNEIVARRLAISIIHAVDQGDRDPDFLADSALLNIRR